MKTIYLYIYFSYRAMVAEKQIFTDWEVSMRKQKAVLKTESIWIPEKLSLAVTEAIKIAVFCVYWWKRLFNRLLAINGNSAQWLWRFPPAVKFNKIQRSLRITLGGLCTTGLCTKTFKRCACHLQKSHLSSFLNFCLFSSSHLIQTNFLETVS